MGRHREGEPHIHAGGKALDRRVEEFVDLGEGDDLVELAFDLGAGHAEDRAVEINILAPRELRVKAGADCEQACNTSAERDPPLRRLGDAGENLQKRALAGTVAADDAQYLAAFDLEADILEGP